MKNINIEQASSLALKLLVVAALIIGASTDREYSYYILLRWLVMVTFIYFGYKNYKKRNFGFLIFSIATALLFNPFIKFWFQKATWHLIDYVIASFIFVTIIFDWKIWKVKGTA